MGSENQRARRRLPDHRNENNKQTKCRKKLLNYFSAVEVFKSDFSALNVHVDHKQRLLFLEVAQD